MADSANWLSTNPTNNLVNASLKPGGMTGAAIECSMQSFQVKDRQTTSAITTDIFTTNGCVMEGENVSIAANFGTGRACYYIKFKTDLYMYPFEVSTDIHDSPTSCSADTRFQLIPGTDVLIIEAAEPGDGMFLVIFQKSYKLHIR